MHKLQHASTTKLNDQICSEHIIQVHVLYITVNDIEDEFTIVISNNITFIVVCVR